MASSSDCNSAGPENEVKAVFKDLFSGTIGGIAGTIVGQPLDTVKVRLQAHPAGTYSGAVDCAVRTVRAEGVMALYKGLLPPILGSMPQNSVLFAAYGSSSRFLQAYFPEAAANENQSAFLCGLWAGLLQSFVITPLELVKCKLQYQTSVGGSQYKGAWDCFRQTAKANGLFSALFRGCPATIIRDAPSFGVYFWVYEGVKEQLRATFTPDETDSTHWMQMIAGGLAGSAAWGSTYPFDVVKSIQQTLPEHKPETMMQIFRSRYAAHGARFFMSGFATTVVRAFPANAAILWVYELCMTAMKDL